MTPPIRVEMEPTPRGRLAAIMREEIYIHFSSGRRYPPDYADFEAAISNQVAFEILTAKLEEARLKPANGARIEKLLEELGKLVSKTSVILP